jgi:hypothetical protein
MDFLSQGTPDSATDTELESPSGDRLAPALPSSQAAVDDSPQRPPMKRPRPPDEDAGVEVMASGQICRAPLPMAKVLCMEAASRADRGAYFVELMRRRLQGLVAVQDKWLQRACNRKHPEHTRVQGDLKLFLQSVLEVYSDQFGAGSQQLPCTPLRQRARKESSML